MEKVRGFELAISDKETGAVWDSKLPERATASSAGYDIFSAETVTIPSIWKGVFHRLFIGHKDGSNPKETHLAGLRHGFKGKSDDEKDKSKKIIQSMFKPTLVSSGVKAYMPDGEVLMLYNRSSNPSKLGLLLANGVGVIDKDYYGNVDNDGNIMFAFINILPWDVEITKGSKLGQGVFTPFLVADNDNASGDRTGGFGSTDK